MGIRKLIFRLNWRKFIFYMFRFFFLGESSPTRREAVKRRTAEYLMRAESISGLYGKFQLDDVSQVCLIFCCVFSSVIFCCLVCQLYLWLECYRILILWILLIIFIKVVGRKKSIIANHQKWNKMRLAFSFSWSFISFLLYP